MSEQSIKQFYTTYDDRIRDKRLRSKYPLRAYAHLMQYEGVAQYAEPGMRVLDAGCGDGVLSFMLARRGARVVGTDLSEANIKRAKAYAAEEGLADRVEFLVADSEKLPFEDSSFDLVVSSHVLEHLPDFDKGLSEILRVAKKRAIVAIPTIMNPCSLVQVGGGMFYLSGLRSFAALPFGFFRMMWAFLVGAEGVDESYAGHDVPHIFRFPWIFDEKVARANARIVRREASSVCVPYFHSLLPLVRFFDRYRAGALASFGYGTTYVVEKTVSE